MGCKRIDSPPRLLLKIDGAVKIDGAQEIADEFRKALDSELKELRLDLSGITDTDVSFLQLVLSLSISVSRLGRNLAIDPLPKAHPFSRTAGVHGVNIERLFAPDSA